MSAADIVHPRSEDTTELNSWARLVAQTYITWYTGFFAFNAGGLGYVGVITKAGEKPPHYFVMLFMIFNLLGVCSSSAVAVYGVTVHRKLNVSPERLSPFPLGLWLSVTAICIVSLVVMAVIWWGLPK
jgi:hypothetical protein